MNTPSMRGDRRTLPTALFALLCVPLAATAQDGKVIDKSQASVGAGREVAPSELEAYCANVNCQRDRRVQLQYSDGRIYDRTFDLMPPAVQSGIVSILPGHTVRAVPIFEDGRFTGWREPKADEPATTQVLTIAFRQLENRTMMAEVSTNTGPSLQLKMGMVLLEGDDRPRHTSSCTVHPGIIVMETWPQPLFNLLVADPAIVDSDVSVCK